MKNNVIYFLLLSIFIMLSANTVLAQTSTPSATREQEIKELKDKLATKVAELKITSQKVFLGTIKTLSDQKIILTTDTQEININLDENTSLQQEDKTGSKKNIKISQLAQGQTLLALGTFNKDSSELLAKNIVARDLATTIVGAVKSVDKKNYQLMVLSNGKEILVDHQTTTKDFLYEEGKNLQKIGFSKFSEGQTVYVYGFMTKDKDGKEMLSAERIIILR